MRLALLLCSFALSSMAGAAQEARTSQLELLGRSEIADGAFDFSPKEAALVDRPLFRVSATDREKVDINVRTNAVPGAPILLARLSAVGVERFFAAIKSSDPRDAEIHARIRSDPNMEAVLYLYSIGPGNLRVDVIVTAKGYNVSLAGPFDGVFQLLGAR